MDQTQIKERLAHEGIQWRFNPPVGYGGMEVFGSILGEVYGDIFEALFKSARKDLRLIFKESRTTDEELLNTGSKKKEF